MKSYIFRAELSEDQDGRWNAVIPNLKACYTWSNTRAEALAYIQDALRCCLEEMLAQGEPLPTGIEVIDAPVAAVTL